MANSFGYYTKSKITPRSNITKRYKEKCQASDMYVSVVYDTIFMCHEIVVKKPKVMGD